MAAKCRNGPAPASGQKSYRFIKKTLVGSRSELRHRRFCYPALQHLGALCSIFEAEHQTPVLVNRHPVDQVEPEPVAVLDRQRVVKGHQLGDEAIYSVTFVSFETARSFHGKWSESSLYVI